MRSLYICDIDGTISNLEHRLHLIQGESPDWDEFHKRVLHDKPVYPVINIIKALRDCNHDVWFFTGRMWSCRSDTMKWLERYLWIGPIVEMRQDGDFRPDVEIKQEMLDNMLSVDRNRLAGVFDDRRRIVDMWRENGIPCFQVKEGDY